MMFRVVMLIIVLSVPSLAIAHEPPMVLAQPTYVQPVLMPVVPQQIIVPVVRVQPMQFRGYALQPRHFPFRWLGPRVYGVYSPVAFQMQNR